MAFDYREQLREWLNGLGRRGRDKWLWWDNGDAVTVKLYTDGHCYDIRAKPTYLGCAVATRKPRPGEDWNRGNDLADGKFCQETWDRILRDIIAYELVSTSNYTLKPPRDTAVSSENNED